MSTIPGDHSSQHRAPRTPSPQPRGAAGKRHVAGVAWAGLVARRTMILALVVVATLITALPSAVGALRSDIAPRDWLNDASTLLGAPWYTGALTTLTVMVWAAAATAATLAALVARHTTPHLAAAMAIYAAMLTAAGLDDAFLLHEDVVPRYLGVDQTLTFGVYLVVALAAAWRYRDVFLGDRDAGMLLLAGAALALSVLIDLLPVETLVVVSMEEGAKLLGAMAALLFGALVLMRSAGPTATAGEHPPH